MLITDGGRACLADFGLSSMSQTLGTTVQTSTRSGGSLRWMAPEILDDKSPDMRTDIYAFACVGYEVSSLPLMDQ